MKGLPTEPAASREVREDGQRLAPTTGCDRDVTGGGEASDSSRVSPAVP